MKTKQTAAVLLLFLPLRSWSFISIAKTKKLMPTMNSLKSKHQKEHTSSKAETEAKIHQIVRQKSRKCENFNLCTTRKGIFSSIFNRPKKKYLSILLRTTTLFVASLFLNLILFQRVALAESSSVALPNVVVGATNSATRITAVVPAHGPITELQLVPRLIFATLGGAAVGWERSVSKHSAGIRTMALVSLGAAVFTVCSAYGFNSGDPARMAANVASGVGFLGAGVITTESKKKETAGIVHGLTTAAAIWLSAAMGVASGMGLYLMSTTVALSTIGILRLGRTKKQPPTDHHRQQPKQSYVQPSVDRSFQEDRETLDTTVWDENPPKKTNHEKPIIQPQKLDILRMANNNTQGLDLTRNQRPNITMQLQDGFLDEIFLKRKTQERGDGVP